MQERRKAAGIKGHAQPNMVCSSAVHVCWEKLFNYFDIEPRYINLTEDCFVAKPEKVRKSVTCKCGLWFAVSLALPAPSCIQLSESCSQK